MGKKVYVFDTTLRDGEQTPGISLNFHEKLEVAKQLEKLNVDAIEAGFPAASKGDAEAVKIISQNIKRPTIVGLARALEKDIEIAWESLKYANNPMIHVFIATSDIHLKYKLNKTRDEVLKQAIDAVCYAKSLCNRVEFSAEDATRTDPEFLLKVYEAAIEAGANVINIPDTVGYLDSQEFGSLVKYISDNTKCNKDFVISVHCHNDLGMATANALSGIKNGASQVECTVNGLGERAGNTSLEEVVMALKTRKNLYGCYTDIKTENIYRTSILVSHITGISIQPNKAIVGSNAFAHEAGIHQHGMLKNPETYEIMTPESIGLTKSEMVLGKHSGRHAFEERLISLGYSISKEKVDEAFLKFKSLADKKKQISDKDIEALINEEIIPISV